MTLGLLCLPGGSVRWSDSDGLLGTLGVALLVDSFGWVAVRACSLSFHAWLAGVAVALIWLMVCVARPHCACLSVHWPARALLVALLVALPVAVLICSLHCSLLG